MSSFILYLSEASGVLIILYTLYWVLLSKETFFSLNRFFLLAIPAFSFLFPLLRFDLAPSAGSVIDKPIGELRHLRLSYYDALEAWSYEAANNSLIPENVDRHLSREKASTRPWLLTIALIIYGMGFATVVLRLVWSYCWIQRLKNLNQKEVIYGLTVVKVSHQVVPFSFMNSVFIHKDMVLSEDFDQILAHEKTHIQERHSLDLIFVQLAAACLWFNPVVWQLVKSLKTTHEYIADKKTIDQGYSLVTYQSLLLRQLISNNSYGLIHNFNLSFIKRRIIMMNVKKSGWAGKAKVALVLSAVAVFSMVMMQCNSKLDEQDLLDEQASSTQEVSNGIDVPVLPAPEFAFKLLSYANTLNLNIEGNKVTINGEEVEVDQIPAMVENVYDEQAIVVARIGRTQPMALVRDVQNELRKAKILKILYMGQTQTGEQIEVALRLPPEPGTQLPAIDDEFARKNNLDMLKIQIGENNALDNQQKVYDFLKGKVAEQKSNYVVSARFKDYGTFNAYLENVYYLQNSFFQIYSERAKSIYGMDFTEIYRDKAINSEYAKVYDAIKKDFPMAISIAED